jgi:small subunit ribosomal protein S13
MARIAGIDLPVQKRLYVGLTAIYGIGQERAKKLAEKANVDHNKKIRDLTEDEVNRLRQAIEQEGRVEGDLRKEVQMNIRRLIEIQAYRGIRHRRNLPVRGQRTHTNARTRKGPRKGMVQRRAPAAAPPKA